jgi:tRNA pseudouridine55 synthase
MAATRPDGLLLVDKPGGVTSQDAVTRVRRAIGAGRAGHTGTLDPFATGLLIVLAGSATRLARYLPGDPKVYDAAILFGCETDTDDATGRQTIIAAAPPADRVAEAMARLTGILQQTPPQYSAKQIDGQRAYAKARRGEAVALAPVPVHVTSWEVVYHDPVRWHVRITCGTGTYIRALARDLGRLSGSAAHVETLRRVRVGPFHVDDATPLDDIGGRSHVRPAVEALVGVPRVRLADELLELVRHGRSVPATRSDSPAALLDESGALVAVAEREGDWWHPRVVLPDA